MNEMIWINVKILTALQKKKSISQASNVTMEAAF